MHKFKSVKLWLLIILIAFTGFLNYSGTITGGAYIDFIKWVFGIYAAGNVGAKLTDKIEVKNKGQVMWNSIDDKMPVVGEWVLILMAVGDNVERAKYKGDGDFLGNWCSTSGKNQTYKVTHWMTSPELPER